jgi:CheY-like chemotaxis protein
MSMMAFTEPVPLAAAPAALGTSDGRKPLVLLVEDHRVNQILGKVLLEALGCRVDVAQDGGEAMRAVRRRGYDLVLMDILMPGLNGTEATCRLRASGVTVPILALTATLGDHDGLLALGFTDCLTQASFDGRASRNDLPGAGGYHRRVKAGLRVLLGKS